jgi:hypothetical protein
MTASDGGDRYHLVVTRVSASGKRQIIFEERVDAYIVGIGDEHPTSISMLVDHQGPWRLQEVLVEEINHTVLGPFA